MKSNFTKSLFVCLAASIAAISTVAQNVSINVLTENSGLVALNGTVLLRVDVTNTAVSGTVVANKVRPQISVPSAISLIPATGHILPTGWTIASNSGSVIRITNTTDPIPAGATRTAYIVIQGTVIGGPAQILANLTFVGAAPTGDNSADNTSSSSIEVTNPTPVTLSAFSASLTNCQPTLKWTTETETNSERFEIERGHANNTGWTTIGTVAAGGFTTVKSTYSFADANLNNNAKKILYRLKMVDKDGRYQYSPVLPVSLNCNTVGISVFPNPAQQGKVYISLTGATGQTMAVLRSPAGQTVSSINLTNGTNILDVSGIANGIYILEVTDEDGLRKISKLLVQQ
jgi:Secretion system C-terminal sorting domain